jgi:hypothetical protein
MRLRISATVTLWVNRVIFVSVAALAFLLPWLMDLYTAARPLDSDAQKAIFLAYYACTPVVLFALWNIEWLVRRILAGDVFIPNNVRRISRLRWCCLLSRYALGLAPKTSASAQPRGLGVLREQRKTQ